jgi:CheY-like chemotaxis protein
MGFPAVLCIDDRMPVLELRKVTLESHGYRVHIASSGHTAMKMLSERRWPQSCWNTDWKAWTQKP